MKVKFATMTVAKDTDAAELHRSLLALTQHKKAIVVTDGGSTESFKASVSSLPDTTLLESERGVMPQTFSSLRRAGEGADYVFYTEPDKETFFKNEVSTLLTMVATENPAIAVPGRDRASFKTFSKSQQIAESAVNSLLSKRFGIVADFLYGPLIIRSDLLSLLDRIPGDSGWGWRLILIGLVKFHDHKVLFPSLSLPCPPNQREDTHQEYLHRLRQLEQNVRSMTALEALSTAAT